jgi:hypothetical protein
MGISPWMALSSIEIHGNIPSFRGENSPNVTLFIFIQKHVTSTRV